MLVKRIAFSVVLCALTVWGSVEAIRTADAQDRLYLPVGSVDAATLIGPPPAMGSAEFKEQMAIVMWLQKTRTPQQVAFVERTLDVERFAPILGQDLFTVNGLELKTVIDRAIDEARQDYDALKDVYGLPRPFTVSDAVHPVGDARPVASYPSGHAIRAIVYARLLAAVFPEHEAALLDLAHQVGYGRVIAGVHYPVDVTSGQKLGSAFADVIVAQPAFQEAAKRIKGE